MTFGKEDSPLLQPASFDESMRTTTLYMYCKYFRQVKPLVLYAIVFWGTEHWKNIENGSVFCISTDCRKHTHIGTCMQMLWHCHCFLSSWTKSSAKWGHVQHLQHRCHVPMYWFIMACTKPRSRSCVIDKSQNLIQSYNDGIPSCFSFTFVQLKQSQQQKSVVHQPCHPQSTSTGWKFQSTPLRCYMIPFPSEGFSDPPRYHHEQKLPPSSA